MEPAANQPMDLTQPLSWQAAEGEQPHRTPAWYGAFGLVVLLLVLLSVFVLKSWSFAILVVVMAMAVVLLMSKPPRTVHYSISPKGIYVADALHDFSEFRSFGVLLHATQPSIVLLPVKRFSPGLTIYFPSELGEAIVDMLGARLPIQEVKPDMVDKIVRVIKL